MADVDQAEEQYTKACSAYHRAEAKKEKAELALSRATRELAAAKKAKDEALSNLRKVSGVAAVATARSDALAVAAAADSQASAEYEIGQFVEKFFPRYGRYRGEITSLPKPDRDYYRVSFEDGDEEDIHASQISQYIVVLSGKDEAEVREKIAKNKSPPASVAAAVTPSPPKKKKTKKRTSPASSSSSSPPSRAKPRKLNLDDGPEWLSDMLHFLEEVPHGPKGRTCSTVNANSVIRQVRKLTSGDGIEYKGWADGVVFAKDRSITLDNTDFDALHKEAKAFEATHGQDKGHGWLLLHPIKKMKLYKEYRECGTV